MQLSDIITGDRIVGLCDFAIITEQILYFHQNIEKFINSQSIILVKDFKTIDAIAINTLSQYFERFTQQNKTRQIKIFVYTHILAEFIEYILDNLDKRYEYVIYLHNSDHQFVDDYKKLLEVKHVIKVFSQNINLSTFHPKLNFLPIGIANSMWAHGNVVSLYEAIARTSLLRKTKNLYVNVNSDTFFYRENVLNMINKSSNYNVESEHKPFEEYLYDLAKHKFCLCVRGNGLDTHRFWESLYLGVIPVIINNKSTKMGNYVNYLKQVNIPFFEITENSLDIITQKYTDDFFDKDLRSHLLNKMNKTIYDLDALKLSFYK